MNAPEFTEVEAFDLAVILNRTQNLVKAAQVIMGHALISQVDENGAAYRSLSGVLDALEGQIGKALEMLETLPS